ncbi:MAG: AI-2E family transporter [Bacilli bacterium]|nr:AI-2E family transporter [Bacilli bacterium]
MEKKTKEEINIKNVNEVVSLSSKILHLLYITMIIGCVFVATLLIKEWGILQFVFSLLKVLAPLFIGFVIAWLFNPMVKKLESKGIPRMAGSILVYAIFLVIVFIFLRVLVPTIYTQVNELISNLPGIFGELKNSLNAFFLKFSDIEGIDIGTIQNNIMNTLEVKLTEFTTSAPTTILNMAVSFFSSLVTIGLGLFVGLYMLFDFDAISKHFLNMLPKKRQFEASVLLNNIGGEVRKSVNGTLLVATMVFICDSIGFAVIGLQAPVLFGLLCGVTDLIPYIGPYIGGAVAVVIGFSQSTFIGVMTLIICVIVQCVENFILQPIVMSKTMKLHPVTIMIGLLVFEHFFGILGMILATPCIALLKVIWEFITTKYPNLKID